MAKTRQPILFGDRAVAAGFVSHEQVRHCIRQQNELIDRRQLTMIGELMVRAGFMNPRQVLAVLHAQGVGIYRSAKGRQYNIAHPDPARDYKCSADGSALQAVGENGVREVKVDGLLHAEMTSDAVPNAAANGNGRAPRAGGVTKVAKKATPAAQKKAEAASKVAGKDKGKNKDRGKTGIHSDQLKAATRIIAKPDAPAAAPPPAAAAATPAATAPEAATMSPFGAGFAALADTRMLTPGDAGAGAVDLPPSGPPIGDESHTRLWLDEAVDEPPTIDMSKVARGVTGQASTPADAGSVVAAFGVTDDAVVDQSAWDESQPGTDEIFDDAASSSAFDQDLPDVSDMPVGDEDAHEETSIGEPPPADDDEPAEETDLTGRLDSDDDGGDDGDGKAHFFRFADAMRQLAAGSPAAPGRSDVQIKPFPQVSDVELASFSFPTTGSVGADIIAPEDGAMTRDDDETMMDDSQPAGGGRWAGDTVKLADFDDASADPSSSGVTEFDPSMVSQRALGDALHGLGHIDHDTLEAAWEEFVDTAREDRQATFAGVLLEKGYATMAQVDEARDLTVMSEETAAGFALIPGLKGDDGGDDDDAGDDDADESASDDPWKRALAGIEGKHSAAVSDTALYGDTQVDPIDREDLAAHARKHADAHRKETESQLMPAAAQSDTTITQFVMRGDLDRILDASENVLSTADEVETASSLPALDVNISPDAVQQAEADMAADADADSDADLAVAANAQPATSSDEAAAADENDENDDDPTMVDADVPDSLVAEVAADDVITDVGEAPADANAAPTPVRARSKPTRQEPRYRAFVSDVNLTPFRAPAGDQEVVNSAASLPSELDELAELGDIGDDEETLHDTVDHAPPQFVSDVNLAALPRGFGAPGTPQDKLPPAVAKEPIDVADDDEPPTLDPDIAALADDDEAGDEAAPRKPLVSDVNIAVVPKALGVPQDKLPPEVADEPIDVADDDGTLMSEAALADAASGSPSPAAGARRGNWATPPMPAAATSSDDASDRPASSGSDRRPVVDLAALSARPADDDHASGTRVIERVPDADDAGAGDADAAAMAAQALTRVRDDDDDVSAADDGSVGDETVIDEPAIADAGPAGKDPNETDDLSDLSDLADLPTVATLGTVPMVADEHAAAVAELADIAESGLDSHDDSSDPMDLADLDDGSHAIVAGGDAGADDDESDGLGVGSNDGADLDDDDVIDADDLADSDDEVDELEVVDDALLPQGAASASISAVPDDDDVDDLEVVSDAAAAATAPVADTPVDATPAAAAPAADAAAPARDSDSEILGKSMRRYEPRTRRILPPVPDLSQMRVNDPEQMVSAYSSQDDDARSNSSDFVELVEPPTVMEDAVYSEPMNNPEEKASESGEYTLIQNETRFVMLDDAARQLDFDLSLPPSDKSPRQSSDSGSAPALGFAQDPAVSSPAPAQSPSPSPRPRVTDSADGWGSDDAHTTPPALNAVAAAETSDWDSKPEETDRWYEPGMPAAGTSDDQVDTDSVPAEARDAVSSPVDENESASSRDALPADVADAADDSAADDSAADADDDDVVSASAAATESAADVSDIRPAISAAEHESEIIESAALIAPPPPPEVPIVPESVVADRPFGTPPRPGGTRKIVAPVPTPAASDDDSSSSSADSDDDADADAAIREAVGRASSAAPASWPLASIPNPAELRAMLPHLDPDSRIALLASLMLITQSNRESQ
ncbi:MAG: hypothetical protein AB7K09_16625 [Planctomycetota bacterium]